MQNNDQKPNRFNLKFQDPELEQEFLHGFYNDSIKTVTVSLIIGGILMTLFSVFDYFHYPLYFWNFLYLRFAITICCIITAYIINNTESPKLVKNLITFITITSSAFLIFIISLPKEGIVYRYFPGILLVLNFTIAFIRNRFLDTRKTHILIVVAIFFVLFQRNDFDMAMFTYCLSFTICNIFLSFYAAYSDELSARTKFLLSKENQQKRDELYLQNKRLMRINEEKDDLFKWVIHDLRTPITVVLNYVRLIQKKTPSFDKETTIILSNIYRMNEMVNNLLKTSALEEGTLELVYSNQNIVNILQNIVSDNQPWIDKKGQKVSLEFSKTIYADVDKEKVRDILTNLYSNAIKYSQENKKITIRVFELDDKYFQVEFADQGEGIDNEDQKKLFTKFGKTKSIPTAGENSSGLGLYIVKKITLEMGGEVGYQRNEPSGSIFWIKLPMTQK